MLLLGATDTIGRATTRALVQRGHEVVCFVPPPARVCGAPGGSDSALRLPIGGPGEAITPRQQGEHLFALLGRPPKFKQVPVALLDGIIKTLSLAGRVLPPLTAKAALARIGR